MTAFGLSPSDPAALRIREAAARGTLSHALLFTGGAGALDAARYAAAAMECQGEGQRPCGVCPACRKVLADIHPDVVTVRDPEHKNIAVEVVRAIRADAYIRPTRGSGRCISSGLRPFDRSGPEHSSEGGGGRAALCGVPLLRRERRTGAPNAALPLRGADDPVNGGGGRCLRRSGGGGRSGCCGPSWPGGGEQ